MIHNSFNLAVASSSGLEVYDCLRNGGFMIQNLRSLSIDEEVLLIKSFQLPNTQQSVITAVTLNGNVLLFDMRTRQPILKGNQNFPFQRYGRVSAISSGTNAYCLSMGTLGGIVANYDLRFGLATAVFEN